MPKRLELPKFQAFDDNGDPLSGGKVYTWAVGTDTLKTSHLDPDGLVENTNPVILDSRGEADIYLTGTYKIGVYTSADALVWTLDNVVGSLGSGAMDDYHYPDATAVDQGVTGNSDTIKYAADSIFGMSPGDNNGTIYLKHDSTNTTTTTYTLTTSENLPVNVYLDVEPGAIIDGAGTLTIYSPENILCSPKQQIFGPSITLNFTKGGTAYPEWKGAVGDGSTDDSDAIQAVIDALETPESGVVQFLARIYVCNIEAKSYVELRGVSPLNRVAATGSPHHENTILKANATGDIITTAAGALYGLVVRNIGFIGLGSGTALRGIYLQNVSRSFFEGLAFDNFADEAIRINDGNANHFSQIFAQNCLLDTSRAEKTGVLHIAVDSNDNWVGDCEFTASPTGLSDANAYLCAVFIDSGNNFLTNVVGELSDVGFHLATNAILNRLTSCRADLNNGHGFELVSAIGNQFSNCLSLSNGHETDNTYDGFHSEGCSLSIFTGCQAYSYGTDTEKHRYGFYDDVNNSVTRSKYIGNNSYEHKTASYYTVGEYGIGPVSGDESMVLTTADDATPSVDGFKFFNVSAATGALNITNFDDGTPGKVINVIDTSANGYVNIIHNASNIVIVAGVDVAMVQNKIYSFLYHNSVWYGLASYT